MTRGAFRSSKIETPLGTRFGVIATDCYISRSRIVELVVLATMDEAFDHRAWSISEAESLEMLAMKIRDGYAKGDA